MLSIRPKVLFAAGILCSGAFAAPQPAQDRSPLSGAIILIVRHAEKPDEGAGLTPIGQKRAAAYVGYFKSYRVNGKPLYLSHLFAAKDSKNSERPRLTLEPLAHSLNANLDLRFSDKNSEELAQDLMAHDYGKEILIGWRHGRIPDLLKALGADPHTFVPEGKWPGEIYDRVIELHFDSSGKIDPRASRLVFEHLLPGDEERQEFQ